MSAHPDRFMIHVTDHKAVPCNAEQTVLECAEQHDIEIHYHCREGFCGACRTRLLSGNVAYTTDPLAFIDDDEILACCCIPQSDLSIQLE